MQMLSSTITRPLPSSDTAASTRILDTVILPALNLAKAGATGISIAEPIINGVLELATMVSTMKVNKEDLLNLEQSLNAFSTINVSPGASEDLKARLLSLSSSLKPIAQECKTLAVKKGLKQFLTSKAQKEKIQGIMNLITIHLRDFIFYGSISIENAIEDMASKEILSALKCAPARYNGENTPDRCMDGTRVDIIKNILKQLTAAPSSSQRIVMLSGSAGSGKSTIAKSIAAILADQHVLAASFFFSRNYVERQELRFFPSTIAQQLADYNADFRHQLVKFLRDDHTGIHSAEPRLQFQKLVVQLLEKIPPCDTPWVVCLDALDECGKDRGQILLRWLSDSMSQIPTHIRFLLTGRPDVPSYVKFDTLQSLMHGIILDDMDSTIVNEDIRLYLKHSLDGSTWTTRDLWKVPAHQLDEIIDRAGGLFIFAATAVRYILAGLPQNSPQRSVEYLLGGAPLTHLYDLYHRIVDDAITLPSPRDLRAQDSYDRAMKVLSTILHLFQPLSTHDLAALLDMDVEDLKRTLLPLSAVIQIPEGSNTTIRIIHLSFREFMTIDVKVTRPDLLCGTDEQRCSILADLLHVMNTKLKFNICDLPTSYLRNIDLPDLTRQLDTCIPGYLRYCCRFWAHHVETTPCSLMEAAVGKLLSEKFLFWLEVLSLLGWVSHAFSVLAKISAWNQDPFLARFVADAKRFIAFFLPAISQSAPHIYVSALAMAPQQSEIWKQFHTQFPRLISFTRGQMQKWPATTSVLEGHTGSVQSVAFSHNGKYIVSGSSDTTVRVWNAETGEVVGVFEGHTHGVTTVAFSPHDKQIVSGSDDRTVCIWDAESGDVLQVLKGHKHRVTSVAFSPSGKLVVSGSQDNTLRVWDVESGKMVGDPYEGHTGYVFAVAFSPNSQHIVSGSLDTTVRVWDVESGKALGDPFEGHSHFVYSVAFSPDGKQIVSGSHDSTVRVWNAGTAVELFEGNGCAVKSVAFSSNGKHILSGFSDQTVQILDAESGEVLGGLFEKQGEYYTTSFAFSLDGNHVVSGSQDNNVRTWDLKNGETLGDLFEGHTHSVNSVAWSPNGKHIVSGSLDSTHIWDAKTGEALGRLFESSDIAVQCVAFSPDGKFIAAGSWENTVHIWDVVSGKEIGGPVDHHGQSIYQVKSVAFSPDGKHIVSGSRDTTVSIWDTQSGKKVGSPFEGHNNYVNSVAWSPNGKHIISISWDAAFLWDAKSGEVLHNLFKGDHHPASCTFSFDGKVIASGFSDGTIFLWDSKTGEVLDKLSEGHTSNVSSVVFSPNSKQIISGSWDQTLCLWDAEHRELLNKFDGHTNMISSVAFSPDGKQVVSGSEDNSLRIWDVNLMWYCKSIEVNAGHGGASESGKYCAHGLLRSMCSKSTSVPLQCAIVHGWVSCHPGELLFWLPRPQRSGFWWPPTTLVINRQQTMLCYDNFVHGTEWTRCYVPPENIV
ncbi:hypothetical protein C8R44DRAFT_709944 [Mycena epipterygia]|nr:hypothetical protein C8R44DRAFT_709944 [Mycena epipterygia]